MGVCLLFTSTGAVPQKVEKALRKEWSQAESKQSWLHCEPPHFFPTGADARIRGSSKLNLHPWADDVEAASRLQVERNDLQELLRLLCLWSEQYGLTWELSIEDTPLGRIENGFCPGDVEAAIEALADVADYLGREFPQEHPGGAGLRLWQEPE